MAKQIRRVEKAAARVLQPGERVLGAAFVEPRGGLLAAVRARDAVARTAAATSMALAMPVVPAIAALTDQRLVMLRLSPFISRVTKVLASWPAGDVARIESLKHSRLGDVLGIAFADGSAVEVECPGGGDARSLLDAFAVSRGGSVA